VKTSFTQNFSKMQIVQKILTRFVKGQNTKKYGRTFLGKIQNGSINQNGGFRQSNFRKDAVNQRQRFYFQNFIKKIKSSKTPKRRSKIKMVVKCNFLLKNRLKRHLPNKL
jgi:basic membrane lipoprotein Med (substrate-binding protein (PBP1-ABC) superfamily)